MQENSLNDSSMTEVKVESVSDTALWVATYRADEGKRPNAIFKDPLADVLAGERGRQLARAMSATKIMSWVMVVRTSAIDHFILRCLNEEGVDLVLNLGAGLDTRPYRMNLPPALRWVEVDFSRIIEYKNQKLKNEKSVCQLERISLDLSLREERKKLFSRINQEAKKVLIITEGVLPYLPNAAVIELCEDLRALPNFKLWIQDYNHGGLKARLPHQWEKKLKASPIVFKVDDWFEFFSAQGWKRKDSITSYEEAKRIRRPFPFIFPFSLIIFVIALFSRKKREQFKTMAGYTILEQA